MPGRALNNARRLYLCSYDVADDKRRDKLADLLLDHGERIQYSVFLCELDRREHVGLVAASGSIIHHQEDQLIILDIGPAGLDWPLHLKCVGRIWTPLVRSSII